MKPACLITAGIVLSFASPAIADGPQESTTAAKRKGIVVGIGVAATSTFADQEHPLDGETFVGYRLGRITLGLSARYVRFKAKIRRDEFERQRTNLLTEKELSPSVQAIVLSSADKRIELWAGADFGYRRRYQRDHFPSTGGFNDGMETITERTTNTIVYKGSLGLRYWMHPQLALEVSTGVRGTRENKEKEVGKDNIFSVYRPFKTFTIVGLF